MCQLRYAIGAMRQLSKNISSSCRITHKTSSWPAQQSLSLQFKQLLSEEGDQASSSRARRRDASPSSFARCFMSSLGFYGTLFASCNKKTDLSLYCVLLHYPLLLLITLVHFLTHSPERQLSSVFIYFCSGDMPAQLTAK